jgi:hypothetical protein
MQGDLSVRPLLWGGFAIGATVLAVIGSVFLLLRLWQEPADASRVRMPYDLLRPGPLLQSAPQPDLARYRADKQRQLEAPAWVDAQRGIARIPVADAMALMAATAASAPRASGAKP